MRSRLQAVEGDGANAVLAWALVIVLVTSTLESFLSDEVLRAGFLATVVAVAVLPAAVARRPSVVVDWEVLLVSALPALAWLLNVDVPGAAYASIAALALLVVAELDAFTAVEMTPWFAGLTVVVTTLSVAAWWASVQFAADRYLDTAYLAGRTALMWNLVAASLVGVAAGVLFAWYCSGDRLEAVAEGTA